MLTTAATAASIAVPPEFNTACPSRNEALSADLYKSLCPGVDLRAGLVNADPIQQFNSSPKQHWLLTLNDRISRHLHE